MPINFFFCFSISRFKISISSILSHCFNPFLKKKFVLIFFNFFSVKLWKNFFQFILFTSLPTLIPFHNIFNILSFKGKICGLSFNHGFLFYLICWTENFFNYPFCKKKKVVNKGTLIHFIKSRFFLKYEFNR